MVPACFLSSFGSFSDFPVFSPSYISSIGEVYWLIPPDPLRRGILITNAPGRRREVPDRNRYPILGWDASEELGMVILGQDWNGDWENGKTHFWILDIIQETSFLHLQTSCCPKGNWSEESKFRIVSGPGINHFDWMRSLRTFGIRRRDMSKFPPWSWRGRHFSRLLSGYLDFFRCFWKTFSGFPVFQNSMASPKSAWGMPEAVRGGTCRPPKSSWRHFQAGRAKSSPCDILWFGLLNKRTTKHTRA